MMRGQRAVAALAGVWLPFYQPMNYIFGGIGDI
jgi:hypothetical protein